MPFDAATPLGGDGPHRSFEKEATVQNVSRRDTATAQFVEVERPSEWIRGLRETAQGYANLLAESGELLVAAYRVAVARCRTREFSAMTPSPREVRAAALEVLNAVGDRETPVPPAARVIAECAAAGLVVTCA